MDKHFNVTPASHECSFNVGLPHHLTSISIAAAAAAATASGVHKKEGEKKLHVYSYCFLL